jgi:two-component system sensor histidine kinase DegS
MMQQEIALGGVSLSALREESQKEYERLQKELKEIDVLIRQSTAEVEKLGQRQAQLANRVRQMEMNIDTYPRSDIREIYGAAHEAQMRLFMMRGQLEQLQSRQQSLEQQSQWLLRMIESVAQFVASEPTAAWAPEAGAVSSDVVRIIEAQENERQRLARQMHDGPAQSLTNLVLQAEICERLFESDPLQARVELGSLKSSANATFQKIREFILTLRPMMLDDLGLTPTLRQYVQDFENKSGLAASLTVTGREARLPSHTEVTLFRMVQELLTNVQKHAHASQAQVTLDFGEQAVVATVEDDGSGFDVDEVQRAIQQRKGLGLHTLQERAEMLGGRVEYESRVGRGTRVRIEIPTGRK